MYVLRDVEVMAIVLSDSHSVHRPKHFQDKMSAKNVEMMAIVMLQTRFVVIQELV